MVGQRPVQQIVALLPDARRERLVHVDDVAARVGDGNQVRDRIERVLQLPTRPHHVVEQLHVLDGARELTPELVGAIEQIELAARLDAHAFEDDCAEGAAGAA